MDKKLIAFDMDGTLLNSKKKISFLTRQYLKRLSKKGHIIVLASGRPSRSMINYYKQLNLSSPMVCYNGAYCFSPKDKNFKGHEYSFKKEDMISFYEEIKDDVINIMCETDEEIFVDKEDKYLDKFFWFNDMEIHVGPLKEILNKDPMTFIGHISRDFNKFEKFEKAISKYPDIEIRYWTGSPYFELFYKQTSKGASILEIAKYYNIKKENIIAFGDAENDVEMLNVAGTSIAMKNSKKELIEKAKIVTKKDNDHNGIYHTLKQILR